MFDTLFWALYWIDVLNNLGHFFGGPGFIVGCLMMGGGIVAFLTAVVTNSIKRTIRNAIIGACLFTVVAVATCFIPTKNTMYMMLAVKGGEHVVNSETGKKLQKLIDQQLDQALEVLEKKAKKE